MGGKSTEASPGSSAGVYGTLGVPSTGNMPGSRNGAVTWTDRTGMLWLFGGYGTNSVNAFDYLNDLWKFNPSTLEWTWVSGSNTDPGSGPEPVFGTRGTPASGNVPGARSSASGWIDASGNLWLFGGFGNATAYQGNLNDLWEFNPSTLQWSWMAGASSPSGPTGDSGVYGTLGIPAPANSPAARSASWASIDSSGHLLLAGGQGVDSTGKLSDLNDVWEFDTAINQWSWIGGTNVVPNAGGGQPGVYGTLGQSGPSNTPGGRLDSSACSGQSGKIWLFGGQGFDAADVYGYLNDLWEYVPPATLPVISLASGSYTGPQTVSVTDSTANAALHYTSDGSIPTASSKIYSGPITIETSETLQVIALGSGYTASAIAKATYTVTPATPAITWAVPASIAYGTPLTSAQLDATSTVAGSFTYSPAAGTILAVGSHTVTATFTPTDTVGYTGATASVTVTVTKATPANVVTSSASSAFISNPVTFTATLASAAGTPTSTVTFLDGTTQLGTGTLTAGVATCTTSSLTVGTHAITASYGGDANFAAVTSPAFTETIEDFTFAPPSGASTSATVSPGGSANYTLAVTPSAPTSASTITFSLSGPPTGATATFSPTSVAAGSGPTNVTLTVGVPASAAVRVGALARNTPTAGGRIPMALGILLLPLFGLRRARRALGRKGLLLVSVLAAAGSIVAMSGCGGGGSTTTPPSQPQTYTLTVTAAAGSLTHTVSLTLTVQ